MKIGNHILYFEATTMKELAQNMQNWYDNRTEEDKKWGCINWTNIQKEGDKFTCIASTAAVRTAINAVIERFAVEAILSDGEYLINGANPLAVKTTGKVMIDTDYDDAPYIHVKR